MMNFMPTWVEHEKSLINLGPESLLSSHVNLFLLSCPGSKCNLIFIFVTHVRTTDAK